MTMPDIAISCRNALTGENVGDLMNFAPETTIAEVYQEVSEVICETHGPIGIKLLRGQTVLEQTEGAGTLRSAGFANNESLEVLIQEEEPQIVDQRNRLRGYLTTAEDDATSALAQAARRTTPQIGERLQNVQDLLDVAKRAEEPHNVLFAAIAVVSELRDTCADDPDARWSIMVAEQTIRHMFTVNIACRLCVPLSNREAYVAELKRALGGQVENVLWSKLMQSYFHTVRQLTHGGLRRAGPRPLKEILDTQP